ncbi:acylphosphatase [Niveibacterium sp. SC-1]|uniref:acylphosphatase n=1 Tax=Niveibacterium sp. SC-1 TaxID=3135646 RepID=UPI00311DA7F7
MNTPKNDCLHLRIRGVVQGVGFRWSTVREARSLGLRGWVRNRTDGSVEAIAAGPADALAALVRWAHRGPPAARVAEVISEAVADPGDLPLPFEEHRSA